MTADEIKALRELYEKRMMTPWSQSIANDFDAAAREALPRCLDEIERLKRELEESQLARIVADNPGIDIEKVRQSRNVAQALYKPAPFGQLSDEDVELCEASEGHPSEYGDS